MTDSKAYQRGADWARHLRRLEARNIIGGAHNPYKRAAHRALWEAGFLATYWGRG